LRGWLRPRPKKEEKKVKESPGRSKGRRGRGVTQDVRRRNPAWRRTSKAGGVHLQGYGGKNGDQLSVWGYWNCLGGPLFRARGRDGGGAINCRVTKEVKKETRGRTEPLPLVLDTKSGQT